MFFIDPHMWRLLVYKSVGIERGLCAKKGSSLPMMVLEDDQEENKLGLSCVNCNVDKSFSLLQKPS